MAQIFDLGREIFKESLWAKKAIAQRADATSAYRSWGKHKACALDKSISQVLKLEALSQTPDYGSYLFSQLS
ncbi:MAG: hypothetical protein KME46_18480 [Brasilonema angustatum HA4187-MV1]|jgi:hypothetical protein|nr:hypothetical protein [Brasilonema angustatum HA4187-MV1]